MWYTSYGWKENPFYVKSSKEFIGHDMEKNQLVEYAQSRDICLLAGKPGSGKTSMLKWLQRQLGFFTKVIYFNAESITEVPNLKRIVGKPWFRKRVLLIDEAHNCDEQFVRELKNLWDSNMISSVVIAQTGEGLAAYPDSIRSRIGNRVLRLSGMDLALAKEMINLRTKQNHPFSDPVLELIVEEARQNPRRILENCEQVCIGLQGKKELEFESARDILTKKKADALMDLAKLEEPSSVMPVEMVPIDSKKLERFSPMQKRMVMLLLDCNRTAKQVAEIMNTSEGSVGKQLSNLIENNVVFIVNHRRPKVYGLAGEFKTELKK